MIILPNPNTMDYREYRRMIGLRARARATVQWACRRTGFPDLDLVTLNNLLGDPPPYEYSRWWAPIYNGRYEWMTRQLQELIRLLRADPASLGRLEEGNSALNPLMQIGNAVYDPRHGRHFFEEPIELIEYRPREGEIILSMQSYFIRSDTEWREVEVTPRRAWTYDMGSHFECQIPSVELQPPHGFYDNFAPWRPVSIRNEGFGIPLGGSLSETAERIEAVGVAARALSLENIMHGFDRILAMGGSADEKAERPPGELPFKPEEKSDDNYEALIADMDKLLEEEDEEA